MTEPVIVRADPAQFDQVIELVDRLLNELAGVPEGAGLADPVTVRRHLSEAGAQFVAFLAFDAGSCRGVLTLTEAVAAYAGGRYGIISELYVVPESRGHGIGALLLQAARQEGMRRQWPRIDVTAPPDARWDRTVRFYEQHGFILTGRKLKWRLE